MEVKRWANYFLFPDNFIIEGDSYLIISSDKLRYTDYYDVDPNQVLGNLPFGFSNQGEFLSLSVSVKDSSTSVIDHCTIDQTKYGIACFQKNIGLGGGIAIVSNSIVTNSIIHPILVDEARSFINYHPFYSNQ